MASEQLPFWSVPAERFVAGKTTPARLDTEAMTPFSQSASQIDEGNENTRVPPDQLFSFFTSEIILENKVFVR